MNPHRIAGCLVVFLLLSGLPHTLPAQRFLRFAIGANTAYYFGDLMDGIKLEYLKPGFNLEAGVHLNPSLELRFSFNTSSLEAADSLGRSDFQRRRNLYFRTRIHEIGSVLVWHIIPDKDYDYEAYPHPHFSPVVFAGFGVFYMDPQARYQGQWTSLREIGTEGQYLEGDYPDPYSHWQIAFPFGFGVEYRVSDDWGFSLTAGYRYTLTDYIDDVSTNFPDLDQLRAQGGDRAVALSAPNSTFESGDIRGNPRNNDGYYFVQISFCHYLGYRQFRRR